MSESQSTFSISRPARINLLTDYDAVWVAGTTHGTKYWTDGLAPGALYTYLVNVDQSIRPVFVSQTFVEYDGNDGDGFTLPFAMPSGQYHVMFLGTKGTNEQVVASFISERTITVVSMQVTSPVLGETLHSNRPYTIRWIGNEKGVYHVLLAGGSISAGAIKLGDVDAQSGQFTFKVPNPGQLRPGDGFYLWILGDVKESGGYSQPFSISNKGPK